MPKAFPVLLSGTGVTIKSESIENTLPTAAYFYMIWEGKVLHEYEQFLQLGFILSEESCLEILTEK